MASATGDSQPHSGLSAKATATKPAAHTTTKAATTPGVMAPAGRWRAAVRGLAASKRRSTRRLKPMAVLRASTMAATIQTHVIAGGGTGASRAASSAPASANGSAKIVCEKRTRPGRCPICAASVGAATYPSQGFPSRCATPSWSSTRATTKSTSCSMVVGRW